MEKKLHGEEYQNCQLAIDNFLVFLPRVFSLKESDGNAVHARIAFPPSFLYVFPT